MERRGRLPPPYTSEINTLQSRRINEEGVMRTVEDYWKDWERLGFEKKVEAGCIRYTALPELGRLGVAW